MLTAAIRTFALGEENQMLGMGQALSNSLKLNFNKDSFFISPVSGKALKKSAFPTAEDFQREVFLTLNEGLKNTPKREFPHLFISVYSPADNEKAGDNADFLAKEIKNYYRKNNLGRVAVIVLNSASYPYRYADYANIPSHLQNQPLNRNGKTKVIPSIGIIDVLTPKVITEAYQSNKALQNYLFPFIDNKRPNVVICLGGTVQGKEITFDTKLADSIFKKARTLNWHGNNVFILDDPRTPNDVIDYFMQNLPTSIPFFNCKPVARTASETNNPHYYMGYYQDVFVNQMQLIGNVYPAILNLPNTIVFHTFDSFAGSATAQIPGLATGIITGDFIDRNVRPDCYRLAENLIKGQYAVGFDDFIAGKKTPENLNLRTLPNPAEEITRVIRKDITDAMHVNYIASRCGFGYSRKF